MATILVCKNAEYLYLCDRSRRLTIRLENGSFFDGQVGLRFIIADGPSALAQATSLRNFVALRRRGSFDSWTNWPERRAARWSVQLRAFDAVTAGASEHDVAVALLGEEFTRLRWRDGGESARSRVRRLIRSARSMVAGGYRDILMSTA